MAARQGMLRAGEWGGAVCEWMEERERERKEGGAIYGLAERDGGEGRGEGEESVVESVEKESTMECSAMRGELFCLFLFEYTN